MIVDDLVKESNNLYLIGKRIDDFISYEIKNDHDDDAKDIFSPEQVIRLKSLLQNKKGLEAIRILLNQNLRGKLITSYTSAGSKLLLHSSIDKSKYERVVRLMTDKGSSVYLIDDAIGSLNNTSLDIQTRAKLDIKKYVLKNLKTMKYLSIYLPKSGSNTDTYYDITSVTNISRGINPDRVLDTMFLKLYSIDKDYFFSNYIMDILEEYERMHNEYRQIRLAKEQIDIDGIIKIRYDENEQGITRKIVKHMRKDEDDEK